MTATVLVVDDTAAHRYVMASWLRRAGYTVVEAGTGAAALELAGPHLDAVVLDVNLPDIPGPEVCGRIKAAPATEQLPVLHVSATSTDARARTAGLERGADAYLVEPLDRGEFLATVGVLCRTRQAHRGVGQTALRMERLASALVPLHEVRSYERLVDAAASGACDVLGRPVIAVVGAERDDVVRALCTDRDATPVQTRGTTPLSGLAPGHPGVLAAPDLPAPWQELFAQVGPQPGRWYATVLKSPVGEVVGGLAVGLGDDQPPLSDEDVDVTRRFAEAMTVALNNLRSFAEEHRIALALQTAMLPRSLPDDGALAIAARYVAADAMLAVGGDFYDAFGLDDGRTAVVIGDVQGHSLRAATVMGELRIALRAYLAEGHCPARAVDLLNRLLMRSHPEFVTACVALLDPASGQLEVVNAGHLPPIVLGSDGGTRQLGGATRLLGLATEEPREGHVEQLAPGDTVLLYTDGLVERRGVSLQKSIGALERVAARAAGRTPQEVCDAVLGRFDDGHEDDVAVLAVRWSGAPAA